MVGVAMHDVDDAFSLCWSGRGQNIVVQPWGKHSLRVRIWCGACHPTPAHALLEEKPPIEPSQIELLNDRIRNGILTATIDNEGHLQFSRAADQYILLDERRVPFSGSRRMTHIDGQRFQITQQFAAQSGERFYGLGQRRHGLLDQKGCTLDLLQYNTHVSVPFLLSSRGYGFLWNCPATGRVDLGYNHTRWCGDSARCIDYWITTADSYHSIYKQYAQANGFTPMMPEWATGFWQCKLRYKTQDELLQVAREYKRRGLPLSVIVIDYFHWTAMNDWQFHPEDWPDPEAMIQELQAMGIELMVSVWPTVNPDSKNFKQMKERGLLTCNRRGVDVQRSFRDRRHNDRVYLAFYDATHPEARRFLWQQIREGYYSKGIKWFWLDCNEPEINPFDYDNLMFHTGPGSEVACTYPMAHCRAFYDGLKSEDESQVLTLARSSWAGGQRYGTIVWSGDIHSNWDELAGQIRAGLNMQMAGFPWWTTDIGGFSGGDPEDPDFRELLVRWFQWAVFGPIMRLHGVRLPTPNVMTGGPNEPWSFGSQVYEILKTQLMLRERLRPYVMQQMKNAHEHGTPPMRPLFFDFPNDPRSYECDDEYLFGPSILVAPFARVASAKGKCICLRVKTGSIPPPINPISVAAA